MIRPTTISVGVTANQASIASRGNSAVCLVRKAKAMRTKEVAPQANSVPMASRCTETPRQLRYMPPISANRSVDDDGHGGGDHVVLDAARKSTLDSEKQADGDTQGVT